MQANQDGWSLNKVIAVSAAAGIVALLILLFLLSFGFWSAFLWGLVVGTVVFIILMLNFYDADGAASGTVQAPASAPFASTSDDTASGLTPTDSVDTPASVEETVEPVAAEAAVAAESVYDAPSGSVVKPSTPLAGQDELAARKGEWKYEGDGAASEATVQSADEDYDKDGTVEGTDEGSKPAMLSAAREGGADNLKEIKGVGPKMEQFLNSLGVYHFDQVAGWSADEVAWVDANLKGFKGRVSRDGWVDQAKILASGGETEFSTRVDKGEVY